MIGSEHLLADGERAPILAGKFALPTTAMSSFLITSAEDRSHRNGGCVVSVNRPSSALMGVGATARYGPYGRARLRPFAVLQTSAARSTVQRHKLFSVTHGPAMN
jgi:hypothetical protein